MLRIFRALSAVLGRARHGAACHLCLLLLKLVIAFIIAAGAAGAATFIDSLSACCFWRSSPPSLFCSSHLHGHRRMHHYSTLCWL